MAEKYYPINPYALWANNPMKFIDPDGMMVDWYLNLHEGRVEHREGSENHFNEALVHLATDDATVGDIEDALSNQHFEYRKDPSVAGGFRVDTDKQYKGWAMMQQVMPMVTIIGLGSIPAKMPQSKVASSGMYNAGKGIVVESVQGGATALDGSFSITELGWQSYPAGGTKPTGPFRLIEGVEYSTARDLANTTNAAMRRANPGMFKGLQIHEIQPVKFGGSPTDFSNKIFLTPEQHRLYNTFWFKLQNSMK